MKKNLNNSIKKDETIRTSVNGTARKPKLDNTYAVNTYDEKSVQMLREQLALLEKEKEVNKHILIPLGPGGWDYWSEEEDKKYEKRRYW